VVGIEERGRAKVSLHRPRSCHAPLADARAYWAFRNRKSASAGVIGLSALSSETTASRCEKPSAMTTSKPPFTSPNVGKAGFGTEASMTRGVPLQLGAVHTPMLLANGV